MVWIRKKMFMFCSSKSTKLVSFNSEDDCHPSLSYEKEKLHASIKRTKACSYQGKWLKFRIEESNTRGILNFRAEGIKYFGPLHFAYICPAVGQMQVILTSSVIWMYVTVKQKHVIETTRKKAVFVKIHNFTYLGFDNVFKFYTS